MRFSITVIYSLMTHLCFNSVNTHLAQSTTLTQASAAAVNGNHENSICGAAPRVAFSPDELERQQGLPQRSSGFTRSQDSHAPGNGPAVASYANASVTSGGLGEFGVLTCGEGALSTA